MFTVGSFSTYIIVLVSNALKHGIEACRKPPSMSQLPVPFTYGLIVLNTIFLVMSAMIIKVRNVTGLSNYSKKSSLREYTLLGE
jgi:hypothetical protein